jgi:hypothetical protein
LAIDEQGRPPEVRIVMFLQNRKHVLFGAGILILLAGAGTAALIYHAETQPPQPVAAADASSQPVNYQAANYQPPAADSAGAPPIAGSSDGYYPSISPPVFINQAPPPPPSQPVVAQVPDQYSDNQTVRGRYADGGPVYRAHHRHHGRSKKRSLAIVAGTAATGAAIGAVAGGGPGAAIGAIAGAGAGFTYDRLTHNH